MKKSLLIVTLFLTVFSATLFAQDNNKLNTKIKPEFVVGDVFFAHNVMNTIDIKGNEVEAFLECQNHLKNLAEKAQKANKQAQDKINDEMTLNIARNLTLFLSRASFKGEQAVIFKRFIDSIVTAAEKVK